MKRTCLDCKYYAPKQEVFDGYEDIGCGVLTPKSKVIEHHCSKCPKMFEQWWRSNAQKTREEITWIPKCFELTDFAKQTDELIQNMNDILEYLNKKK